MFKVLCLLTINFYLVFCGLKYRSKDVFATASPCKYVQSFKEHKESISFFQVVASICANWMMIAPLLSINRVSYQTLYSANSSKNLIKFLDDSKMEVISSAKVNAKLI